jgi:hypothetical protein
VAYVTDVEGQWERLDSVVRSCPLLSWQDGELVVAPGALFVFGGDAIDRGPSARRVIRTLLAARRRQPRQVVLLLGNRDLNKLRLPRELAGALPKRAPPELPLATRAVVLRWIFANTMGAQGAFDFRLQELREEHARIDDDGVVQSWLDDLDPGGGGPDNGGAHWQYLCHGQLAFRCGQTLFVHGGVGEDSLGHVPGGPSFAQRPDVDSWIEALNGFCHEHLARYAAHPVVVGQEPDWLPLILYQAPKKGLGKNPESVVYGRFGSDKWNNPRLPSPTARRWLLARALHRVVVGHTPCGDLPTVLQAPEPLQVIIADNSRSRIHTGTALWMDDAGLQGRGHTVLDDDDDSPRAVTLSLGPPAKPPDKEGQPIGLVTGDGFLVKAHLDPDSVALFRFDENWTLRQGARPTAQLGLMHFPEDPIAGDSEG